MIIEMCMHAQLVSTTLLPEDQRCHGPAVGGMMPYTVSELSKELTGSSPLHHKVIYIVQEVMVIKGMMIDSHC